MCYWHYLGIISSAAANTKPTKMFKLFIFACFLALAAAKPGVLPVAYTAPLAAYTAPVAAAYTAPVAYSAYTAPVAAYSAYSYASPYAAYYYR